MSGKTPAVEKQHVIYDSWTFKEGSPGEVYAVAQTTEGFLWVGGPSGLFRFDGARFEPFNSPFGDRLLATSVSGLFAPASGGLWIGYRFGGFSFLSNGRVKNYTAPSSSSVGSFVQGTDGTVWAATTSGVWRFKYSQWEHLAVGWNAPVGEVIAVGFDREGILWVLTWTELFYLRPGDEQFQKAGQLPGSYPPGRYLRWGFTWDTDRLVVTSPPRNQSALKINDNPDGRLPVYPVLAKHAFQYIDRTNSVWIVSDGTDGRDTLRRLAPSEQSQGGLDEAADGSSETYNIHNISQRSLVDREGNIWFFGQSGLYRFFYTPLVSQELRSCCRFALAADDHGAVWISSQNGSYSRGESYLLHVAKGKADTLLHLQGTTECAYRASDKTFWFGSQNALWHLVGRNVVRTDLPREMADSFLQAITQDRLGGLWVSFGRKGLYRFADGVWAPSGGREDLSRMGVISEFSDTLGRVWFGCTKNQLALLENNRVQVFGPGDGLQVGTVTAIYGRGSEIWIGGEFGLQQFDRGRFHNVAAFHQQLLRGISGIVETAGGDLWLNGLSGIVHIRHSEISEALKYPTYQVKGERFGTRAGLPGVAEQLRPLPTAIEGSDGQLWFAVSNGLVRVDPSQPQQSIAPPPIIESFSADGRNYETSTAVSLPARTSGVQINYAAVSLSDPEAIRFRYKLEEIDRDWHEVATASPITYRNLPPGSYHFRVAASDTNGEWSGRAANVDFTLLAAFYQTAWFRALSVGAVLALLAALYRLRLRQLARQYNLRLEERVRERTRIARELHDTLLQSLAGVSLQLDGISKQAATDPEKTLSRIAGVREQIDCAFREARVKIWDLRSPTLEGQQLAAALREFVERMEPATTARCVVSVSGHPRPCAPEVEEELLRIAREAASNAVRHAHPNEIRVSMEYGVDSLRLSISDDGRGFNLEEGYQKSGHWGLKNMQERAAQIRGTCKITTAVGGGTQIAVRVPLSSWSWRNTLTKLAHSSFGRR